VTYLRQSKRGALSAKPEAWARKCKSTLIHQRSLLILGAFGWQFEFPINPHDLRGSLPAALFLRRLNVLKVPVLKCIEGV